MKATKKIDVYQRIREIGDEPSLKRRVMLRAWMLKKTCGVRKSFTYTTAFGIEERSYSVFDFSECLKKAWEIEKEAVKEKGRKHDNAYMTLAAETISSWYKSGRYMGD